MLRGSGFLLDTNVVSESAKERPDRALLNWLIRQPPDALAISFTVSFEMKRGIEKLARTKPEKALKLEQWLDAVIASGILYIHQDDAIARVLAEMTMVPQLRSLWMHQPKSHEPSPGQDLAIAATAIVWGLPVATRDVNDFLLIDRFFPLPGLINPFTGVWVIHPYLRSEPADQPDPMKPY